MAARRTDRTGTSTSEREAAVRPARRRCRPDRRTYVIDTSVLLSDPWALTKFAEHEVVLPLVVIGELEAKRHHPELGYFARQALRILDDLRIEHGRLDAPVPVGRRRRHPARRAEPHRPDGPAGRIPQRHQRLPHPGLCAEPRQGAPGGPGHPGLQGHAAAGQGVGRRAGRRRVPGAGHRAVGLDRDGRAARSPRSRSTRCSTPVWSTSTPPASCRATPASSCSPGPVRRWAGSPRASRSGWSAASGRRSGCAAGRPSSGSRSTC